VAFCFFPILVKEYPMNTEVMFKIAMKQLVILAAVLVAVPVAGITALILLSALVDLMCSQLHSVLILAVVVTAVTLAVREFRHTNP
jgi:hypothetical protein